MKKAKRVWQCRIGEVDEDTLPDGADAPMRAAVGSAYVQLTGHQPVALFSGWYNEFTEIERAAIEKRDPNPDLPDERALLEAAWGIIANAYGGDWGRATQDWVDAASRWRDRYHRTIRHG